MEVNTIAKREEPESSSSYPPPMGLLSGGHNIQHLTNGIYISLQGDFNSGACPNHSSLVVTPCGLEADMGVLELPDTPNSTQRKQSPPNC
jgi:hypothetical protein